jgi:hypothetical protein
MKKYLLLLLAASSLTQAATFNVSTTPELRQALQTTATNGEDDIIILGDGTFSTIDDNEGKFKYLSAEDNSLTIKGSASSSINGGNTDDCFYVQTSNNVSLEISDLTVEQCTNGLDLPNQFKLVNVIVQNNSGYGILSVADDSPIEIYNSLIDGNGYHGISRASGTNSSSGSFKSPTYIENSTVSNNNGIGLYSNTGSGSSGVTLKNTDVYSNSETGIYVGYSSSANIYESNVFDNGKDGIRLGYNSGIILVNSVIYRNNESGILGTLNNAGDYIIVNSLIFENIEWGMEIHRSERGEVRLVNSILANNGNGIYKVMDDPKVNNLHISNSVVVNEGINFQGINGGELFINANNSVLGGSSESSVISSENGVTFSSSDFTDFTNSDFRLSETSALVDSGVIDTSLNITICNSQLSGSNYTPCQLETVSLSNLNDFDGNSRVVGGNIDIGPYEPSTTKPTINSVTFSGNAKEQSELTFTVEYTLSDGRSIQSVEYDYLDNGVYTSSDTYIYYTSGTYTFTVKVTDDSGEFSTSNIDVVIQELPFSEMTYEQKLIKAIAPEYYDLLIPEIDFEKSESFSSGEQYVQNNLSEFSLVTEAAQATAVATATTSGITDGENNVINNPIAYGLNLVIGLSKEGIAKLPSGWKMISIPEDIADLSIFDDAKIVWFFDNETQAWKAYSSNSNTAQQIIDKGIGIIKTLNAGDGIFIEM